MQRAGLRRTACLAVALAWGSSTAAAQEVRVGGADSGGLRGHKRYLYAAIGVVVVGVPTYFAARSSPGGGNCTSEGCLTAIGVAIGAGAGYLMGLDQDRKLTRQLQAGPTLRYREKPLRIPLGVVPEEMTPFADGAVVTGIAGANLVYPDGRVVSRARGIRGIESSAVLDEAGLVVFATRSGLLAFPVGGDTAQGSLLARRGASAIAAVESDLAVGDAAEIRWLRVEGGPEEPVAEAIATVPSGGLVSDLGWNPFQRVAWALVEDRLVAYAPGTLEKLGEVALPGPGIALRVRGDRAAVAAGAHGVALVDVTDPRAPRVVQRITGMGFAYAADAQGERLYIAAGAQGLLVMDISDESSPSVVGVARTLRFARDVFADDGRIWVLDREGRKIEIAEITRPEAARR